jgi:hypothetical protein
MMAAIATDILRIVPLPLFWLPSTSIMCLYCPVQLSLGESKTVNNSLSIKDLKGRRRMSEDKEKVESLTRKVDELVVILNGIMEDLRQVSGSLKSLAVSRITQPLVAPPPTPLPRPAEKIKAIEDIKMMFPDDLENLLSFEEKEDYVIIKPRQFLGSENFSKIASAVRQMGGDYVSAGKASHFRVPKKTASSEEF